MRRISTIVVSLALLLSMLLSPVLAAYSDVAEDKWYSQYVTYVDSHGLFNGISGQVFSPETVMDRSMFVTVLHRLSLDPATEFSPHSFTDVPDDTWYTTAVKWAFSNQIIEGTSETTFSPTDPVTREQICTLILRYCKLICFALPETSEGAAFDDQAEIGEYALEAVAACQKAGIIEGNDGLMRPKDSATRAEVAAIFSRFGTILEEAGYTVGPGKAPEPEPETNPDDAWQLYLVNPWNSIPEGYVDTITLKLFENGQQVDARIYDSLSAMVSAMRAKGYYIVINSGFRTHDTQKALYQANIYKQMRYYGCSYAAAEAIARKWVAYPGTSEHELGLAVDINMYAANSYTVHSWLAQHSWEYGFILRYPNGKTDITGINPESWHYRYVGKEHAKAIYESGLTLEEYLSQ